MTFWAGLRGRLSSEVSQLEHKVGKVFTQLQRETFLIVNGVDGCSTIIHRFQLREHLGWAHRKHAYQIKASEPGMSHVEMSLL